jgi:glycerol-3-phosphate dehydrogenase
MDALRFDRPTMLRRLESETFDVVVVGGGITGVGVALDAVSRGLRTALVERDDFASGTSSKSSKLVHGGLRYLQQGEVRLVYEALYERQRLRRNAPHLVSVMPFMLPILTKDGLISKKIARALGSALWMYDVTGGLRIGRVHRRLRKSAALAHMPTMPDARLASAYLYYDTAADDARLCLTVARTAAARGAVVVNRCPVVAVRHDEAGRASGVDVDVDGRRVAVTARAVVNAAGVWSDDIRAADETEHAPTIRPAKGVHITVPWHKVRNDIAVVIPVPGDKRSLFVVPWGDNGDGTFRHSYVGTTDTDYTGPLDDPQCTKDDIDYVLRALNKSVTTGITRDDITGVWAGLRPLVSSAPPLGAPVPSSDPATAPATAPATDGKKAARTADLSRRHAVTVSPSGVVSVTGGKLTTYREMASDTIDAVLAGMGRSARCRTKRLRLLGAMRLRTRAGTLDGHLDGRYGTLADEVRALIAADQSLGDVLVEGLPYRRAEVVYAARHEMATTVDDVLSRRTRARLLDRAASERAAHDVGALLATELGWDTAERDRQVNAYLESCAHEDASNHVTEAEIVRP